MLTSEQIQEIQKQHEYLSDERRRVKASGALPEPLRPIAYGLLYRDAQGKSLPTGWEEQAERDALRERAVAQLDALAPAERLHIFDAFFPSVPEAIALYWTYLRDAPYQPGSSYRQIFFRAPHRPDVTLGARGVWLHGLLGHVGPHDDLLWLARHAAYLERGGDQLGMFFAAVIDADPQHGPDVFELLLRSARGEDEIGRFGRHIPIALLAAGRPDGWECVERLLLGAQREEGVRQTILEALPLAQPPALRRLLGVILDAQLVRFSAVTRAVNSWLGTEWDSAQARDVTRALRDLHTLLGDADARAAALASGSGEEAYLALWATACEDIYTALPAAERLLDDVEPARRYAATRLLTGARIPEAQAPLLRALEDPDARIVAQACVGLREVASTTSSAGAWSGPNGSGLDAPGAFERIEGVLPRLPRQPVQPAPLLWNAPVPKLDREQVADLLLFAFGLDAPKRLIPYLAEFSDYGRSQAVELLAHSDLTDPEVRAALLALFKGRAAWVRERAYAALRTTTLQEEEAPLLEALLTRKDGDLRRDALTLLLTQPDDRALASAERLLAARNEQQRLAGLEALRLLHEAGRARAGCAADAARYRERHPTLTVAEQALLAPILEERHEVPTLENALGLVRAEDLTPPLAPVLRGRPWTSPAAVSALRSLDDLIHAHRADTYTAKTWQGDEEVALVSDPWRFPAPDPTLALDDALASLPFASLWREWAATRAAPLRDEDGLELLRMLIQITRRGADATRAILAALGQPDAPRLSLRYPTLLETLCWWLIRLDPPAGAGAEAADFLLDHLESVLAQLPERELRPTKQPDQRWPDREYQQLGRAMTLTRVYSAQRPDGWSDAHAARFWRLLRWSMTLPQPHLRYRPQVTETLAAVRAGAASEADLFYQLLGPRDEGTYRPTVFDELRRFSARKPDPLLSEYPIAAEVYARCVRRVLEIELQRGETPTAATDAALSLRSLSGSETFLATLRALGGDTFARGYVAGERSKSSTLSHLLRVTFPAPEETPDQFATAARTAGIERGRLVEAAVYAPQWGPFVERLLDWPGFAEGVWWIHAHTKDRNWEVDEAIRAEWEARISEWTPLASADLYEGAVDATWFGRVYALLGEQRWETLYGASKYASGGAGHARARLFADAMLGRVGAATLMSRITAKRNRDAACALGLAPLPEEPVAREAETLARYEALQAFVRSAQTLGAQRREGDQRAARIGVENLARTAEYADPARFQWEMELHEVAALSAEPLCVTRDAVTVTLAVDPLGQPRLSVEKGGKPLKEIPARLKKDAEIVELRERKLRLEQQGARMRAALEGAMCREEPFTAGELARLLRHPLLAPMLEQLVFAGPTGLGYLAAGGATLDGLDGQIALAPETPVRIAHPYDLYTSGEWSRFQRECVVAERIQPFKQVFREFYPLTEAERREGARSLRYAGQQLQPQQAMALLARRGWITSAQDGSAARTFHERAITVSVDFLFGGGTPVEVEGLTIEGVSFHPAHSALAEWAGPLPLDAIPPILFSEAMRDLDLVVSVAHRGGVDPEGSASTVEMRAALVRETCAALALANVRIDSSHAVIRGTLGEYSVHLGSGVVHRMPGGALCIVPVHAQHRGRLFLPFADDDPKTAEILSKALLLARDAEIRDPLIMEQLNAGG